MNGVQANEDLGDLLCLLKSLGAEAFVTVGRSGKSRSFEIQRVMQTHPSRNGV